MNAVNAPNVCQSLFEVGLKAVMVKMPNIRILKITDPHNPYAYLSKKCIKRPTSSKLKFIPYTRIVTEVSEEIMEKHLRDKKE